MNRFKSKIKDLLAFIVSRYIMPDHEAHKRAARYYTSAEAISLRKEVERLRYRSKLAEKNVNVLKEALDNLVKMAFDVPDGEMTPFVHQAVVTIENAMNYVQGN